MDIAFNYSLHSSSFSSPFEKMGFKGTNANEFNIKAVRDFVKTFTSVDNNRWFLAEDGSSASTFTSDEITTWVTYNSKGYRLYILRIYEENKLPEDRVKREYYDATITLVKELKTDEELFIYLHLQDKDMLKVVRILDGKMELVENFKRG